LLARFKYDTDRAAGYALTALVRRRCAGLCLSADLIVPVPLTRRGLRKRGFNQAAWLARAIGRAAGLPVSGTIVSRLRADETQVGRGAASRRRQGADEFTARRRHVSGLHIVLVDDVVTTGTTLTNCATVLLRAGAVSVQALTLLRAEIYDPPTEATAAADADGVRRRRATTASTETRER
jgi:ComF family protein